MLKGSQRFNSNNIIPLFPGKFVVISVGGYLATLTSEPWL